MRSSGCPPTKRLAWSCRRWCGPRPMATSRAPSSCRRTCSASTAGRSCTPSCGRWPTCTPNRYTLPPGRGRPVTKPLALTRMSTPACPRAMAGQGRAGLSERHRRVSRRARRAVPPAAAGVDRGRLLAAGDAGLCAAHLGAVHPGRRRRAPPQRSARGGAQSIGHPPRPSFTPQLGQLERRRGGGQRHGVLRQSPHAAVAAAPGHARAGRHGHRHAPADAPQDVPPRAARAEHAGPPARVVRQRGVRGGQPRRPARRRLCAAAGRRLWQAVWLYARHLPVRAFTWASALWRGAAP